MSVEEVGIQLEAGSEEHRVVIAELEVVLAKECKEMRIGWRSQSQDRT